jgi:uridine kinase
MARPACLDHLAANIAAVRLTIRFESPSTRRWRRQMPRRELVTPLARPEDDHSRLNRLLHWPRAYRHRRGADSPEATLDRLIAALKQRCSIHLGRRRPAFRTATFDHGADRAVDAPDQVAAADAILLFDGVFLHRPELTDSWDVRIWVEAPFEVTVPRAVRRDAAGEDAAGIEAKYRRRYVPGQNLYLTQCRPREAAHVIVNNTDFDQPELHFVSRLDDLQKTP